MSYEYQKAPVLLGRQPSCVLGQLRLDNKSVYSGFAFLQLTSFSVFLENRSYSLSYKLQSEKEEAGELSPGPEVRPHAVTSALLIVILIYAAGRSFGYKAQHQHTRAPGPASSTLPKSVASSLSFSPVQAKSSHETES